MADNKINIGKLTEEISNRKKERTMVPERLGTATGKYAKSSDEFLNGLLVTLNTGRETPSSRLLQEVDDKVAVKKGERPPARLPANNRPNVSENTMPRTGRPNPNDEFEREEQLYRDMERSRKSNLADSIQDFTGNSQGNSRQPNMNQYSSNNQLEGITNIINNYLGEKLMPILEESTRSVIIEMYSAERLKAVLNENRDMIKELIIEVFRELKAKQR